MSIRLNVVTSGSNVGQLLLYYHILLEKGLFGSLYFDSIVYQLMCFNIYTQVTLNVVTSGTQVGQFLLYYHILLQKGSFGSIYFDTIVFQFYYGYFH